MRISDWSSDVCSSDLHVEQDENAREAERNHDGKPLRCSLQAFELPAPFEIIARRELHIGNLRLRFRHEGPRIAAFEVHLHDDAPLAILAADLVESFGQPDLRPLRERYLPAIADRKSVV